MILYHKINYTAKTFGDAAEGPIISPVAALRGSPTKQTLRPPKRTFALEETAIRGVVQGVPPGVVPGAGVMVSPSNTGGTPPIKYFGFGGMGARGVGGVLQTPAPPVSDAPGR